MSSARAAIMFFGRTSRYAATISRNYHQLQSSSHMTYSLNSLITKNHTFRTFGNEKSIKREEAAQMNETTAAGAAGAGNTATTPTDDQIQKFIEQIEQLTKKIEILEEKNVELADKYKRSLAEGENLRQRLTKQISDAKIFGIQSFCKDLLEVADTLGHATKAVPQEELNKNNPHLKSLYEGLTMTQASLQQVFKRNGLVQLNPVNEKFDPNYHEALFQADKPNVEPNTVIEVTKLGYKLHERVIRPALVGVSKSA